MHTANTSTCQSLLLTGITAALLLAGCSTSPTGRSQLMVISPETAITESKTAYLSTVSELEASDQLVTDPQQISRIRTITGRLITEAVAKYPDTSSWEWSVAIINDPDTLNAWCMAGGRMAIYTGIIDQLNLTDDEIAQIMGHEISHALANHTAEQMSRAMVINAGLMATAAVTDNNAMVLSGGALAAQYALQLPNSRTAETEADRIGIELATRAGYSPTSAVTLWEKMQQASGSSVPEFMSTHPSSSSRASDLGKLAPEMAKLNPTAQKSAVYPVTIVQ
ncbi:MULTISPECIES: M48 family metallopeptidase [unclassified Oceanobacter]|uniref:M48 family metallopeptidase n=2 Tax=Gammaproteobacteria TaxID=1236 RepID=UPI0026E2C7AF|nr:MULTISPECIES: M48 family metallopeptidase [unclassified Oceanobacter]MDO6682167.1 M48 family metallopeptidase [Oceanobacter sp. 5_MG-2023]MDP2504900.1 M48 family metallopeptidase [Oceanobacter sp. 3_MG-2023]MDP2546344.1 M48 family metallopeptidase [Oceanobacter sp. 4_MG-2023]MDP2610569.1 M48 family metallopeptidase [Oceanobacter sp. 1_MG-2023]MDP2613822.1 M48 family metallopeptidase [Oceanobacter sp. 2_MG-2023]